MVIDHYVKKGNEYAAQTPTYCHYCHPDARPDAGGYFGIRYLLTPKDNPALVASGSIEAVEVTIAPELAGKVNEVLVDEGASVKAGDVLFRQDDSLLQAQRVVAVAAL